MARRKYSNDELSASAGVICGQQIAPEIRKEFEERQDFSLARYALERWPETQIAVKTCGRNLEGDLRQYTFGDLKAHAMAAANTLAWHGVYHGHKVLLLQWNSWPCCVAYWGTHFLGAVAVMATPMHVERKYLLKYTGCRAVVAPCEVLPKLRQEIDDRTHVQVLLLTDQVVELPQEELKDRPRQPCAVDPLFLDDKFPQTPPGNYATALFTGDKTAMGFSETALHQYEKIQRLDECLWYFTSGTTGKPKGCTHRQIDLAFAAETYGRNCMKCEQGDLTATDVMMAGPYAMGSNMIFPLCIGACIFLDHEDKMNPVLAERTMAERILLKAQPTIFVSIPGSIEILSARLMAGDKQLAEAMQKCKVITSAGAPLPASTYLNFAYAAKAANLTGCAVLDGIGTSELQHIFISNHVEDIKSGEGSVGRVCLGYEAKLLTKVELKRGETGNQDGELMVRTQVKDISVKYSSEFQPEGTDYDAATKEVLVDGGDGAPWYITGDIAKVHEQDGQRYFYLLGRTKDLASQINEGAERHMGLEDFAHKRTADAVLRSVGLYTSRAEVSAAVGTGSAAEVLIQSVYPVKLLHDGMEPCVFVCGVTPGHWGDGALPKETALEAWTDYIEQQTQTESADLLLVFTPAGSIPRTPAPLLKPKVGEIKKAVQAWVDKVKPANLTRNECLQLSRELKFT